MDCDTRCFDNDGIINAVIKLPERELLLLYIQRTRTISTVLWLRKQERPLTFGSQVANLPRKNTEIR